MDQNTYEYDYDNQAWTVNGVYVPCGHTKPCNCYGTIHAGKKMETKKETE